MGVGAGLYMCDVVKKFTFANSSPDEFLLRFGSINKVLYTVTVLAAYDGAIQGVSNNFTTLPVIFIF